MGDWPSAFSLASLAVTAKWGPAEFTVMAVSNPHGQSLSWLTATVSLEG